MSMTFEHSVVNVKTVSFSYSLVESNTFVLSYDKNRETYVEILTKTEINKVLPYIIYSFSNTYYQTYMHLNVEKGKSITPEKLIGIVCGSVGAFFIILVIIIFVYRKKREINKFIEESSFSTEENDDNEKTYTVTITDNTYKAEDDNWV